LIKTGKRLGKGKKKNFQKLIKTGKGFCSKSRKLPESELDWQRE